MTMTLEHLIPACTCIGKVCDRCHVLLCHAAFSRKRTGGFGLREKCKPCHKLARNERHERNEQPEEKTPRRKQQITDERLAQLRKMPYQEYLQSPEWRRKRGLMLKIAGSRCQLCNAGNCELNVHHRDYSRLGCERVTDLVLLCRECHTMFHRNRKLHKAKDDKTA